MVSYFGKECKKCKQKWKKCKCYDINYDTHEMVLFGPNAGHAVKKLKSTKKKKKTFRQKLWTKIKRKKT